MLRWQDMSLRVRHEAQDAPGRIAEPGHVVLGAVWVVRIARGFAVCSVISEHDLPGLREAIQDPFLACEESSFAVSHGHVELRHSVEERTLVFGHHEPNPAILELAALICCQSGERSVLVRLHEQTGPKQYLE